MISIIVPIFNAEESLENCLNSIKNQTYKDLEIILVNDGSMDNSLEICEKFVYIDSRFRIINKENSGAGEARNTGLRKAKGSYIGFVDSDDIINPRMYEILFKNIIDNKSDVSIIQLNHFYGNLKNLDISPFDVEGTTTELLNREQALEEVLNGVNFGTHTVTKLFKKELFENTFFPASSYGEDSSLIIDVFLKVKNVVFENVVMYYYIHNETSSTEKKFNSEMFDIIRTWEKNEKIIVEKFPDLYSNVHSRVCWAYFSVLDLMIKSNVENEYLETQNIVRFLKKNMLFIVMKSNLTNSRKIAGIALLLNINIYKLIAKYKIKIRK